MPVLDPKLAQAKGFAFLMDFINGKSIERISRDRHTTTETVRKYMKKAAALLIDAAHETVLKDIFPLAVKLYKAELNRQIVRAEKGEEVDMSSAERIMKGMFVFDSPQLKDVPARLGPGEEPDEPTTLISLMAVRPSLPSSVDTSKVPDAVIVQPEETDNQTSR